MFTGFVSFVQAFWPIGLPVALGMAAVFLLLPRPRPFPWLWGAAAGGAALVLGGISLIHSLGLSVENVLFYFFSALAILAGGLLITQANPARAALSFALVVLSSGLFLLQAAPFLMAATIIIYAGAIIVTFLFVLMLAQQEIHTDADYRSREPLLASIAGFVLLGALLYILHLSYYQPRMSSEALNALTPLFDRARQAAVKTTPEEMDAALGARKFFDELDAALKQPRAAGRLQGTEDLLDIQGQWNTGRDLGGPEGLQKMKQALAKVDEIAWRLRTGELQPGKGKQLSSFSGPPPNEPVLRDQYGNAPQRAENVAAIGRSLFTDYLLPVELGGMLLLVATIGAIAIASRREEQRS